MPNFAQIKSVARESLMADFFAVRIEEEGLWSDLQTLLSRIQLNPAPAYMVRLKQYASESANPAAFIEQVKKANLWDRLKELLGQLKLK
jgi:hypothetical protein